MQLVRFCFGAVVVLSNIHLELSKISPENTHNWQMIMSVFTIKAVATVRRQVEQWFSLNRRKWCDIWVQGGRACSRQIEEGQCLKYTNQVKTKGLVSIRLAVCPTLQLEHRTHFPYRSGCLKQSHLKKLIYATSHSEAHNSLLSSKTVFWLCITGCYCSTVVYS